MEATALSSAATIISSSSSPFSIFSPKKRTDSSSSSRIVRLSKSKNLNTQDFAIFISSDQISRSCFVSQFSDPEEEDKDYDHPQSKSNSSSLVPLFRNQTLSNVNLSLSRFLFPSLILEFELLKFVICRMTQWD